jgi:hypothetical protein
MPYEIRYTQIDIPELDAFLEEYDALCEKHGMAFEIGEYGYDGGSYTTIGLPSGIPYLNMDYAAKEIPCIADAYKRADAIREERNRAERIVSAARAAEEEKRLFAALKAKYEPTR